MRSWPPNWWRDFEKRVEPMDGKAMIVCMSRRICVDLYPPDLQQEPVKTVLAQAELTCADCTENEKPR